MNSIVGRITSIATSIARPVNETPLVSTESTRVWFPTTAHIIVPSLSATPPPSRDPIILGKLDKSLASKTGILFYLDYGGGNKGGRGSDDYWSRFFSLSGVCEEIETPQQEWDSHGLPTNVTVQLNELTSGKKYMVYDVNLFDESRGETLSSDDPIVEYAKIIPGKIYNKAKLQKKLVNLQTSGLFENVVLEAKTNFNGTISIKIPFKELRLDYPNNIRCISVGLLPKLIEYGELEEWKKEREYKRRIEGSRPCVLPDSEQRGLMKVLKKHGNVRAKPLLEIRKRVNKWYNDNGYAWAQVVNLGNLHTKEIVCEVVEGDITRMEFQFQDNNGNVIDGEANLPLIIKELPKQFRQGQICNMEHAKQALENLSSLYSTIDIRMFQDDESKEGIKVAFVFTVNTNIDENMDTNHIFNPLSST